MNATEGGLSKSELGEAVTEVKKTKEEEIRTHILSFTVATTSTRVPVTSVTIIIPMN